MLNRILIRLARLLLALRYRVRVRGLDAIRRNGRTGILFLPNHPALIDPIILFSQLHEPFKVVPLADRDQIDRFFIRRMARRFGVLPIPDVAADGSGSADEVRKMIGLIVHALGRGDNVMLYPAGHVYRQYLESIGGASAVETILRQMPEVRIVLVRTRGLWGSRFSWASGKPPDVAAVLRGGVKSLLLNGLFFTPRRRVDVELVEPADFPRTAERRTLNAYLEAFYNDNAPPNTYVPYGIWERGSERQVPEPAGLRVAGEPAQVRPATRRIVADYLHTLTGRERLADEADLARDLGLDSLAKADLALWLAAEFGFAPSGVEALRTVGDVMLAASGEVVAAGPRTLAPVPARWFNAVPRAHIPDRLADMTVTEAFLLQARRSPGKAVIADQAGGVKTYRDLVTAIMALRPRIAQLPGQRDGVMLPASVAANVLCLATLFAGKTPVMVNWTLGRANLRHCIDSAGVQRILTARPVIQRIHAQGIELGELRDRLICLEDIAAGLTRWAKLRAWLAGRLSWASLRKARPPATAAILFTSGSESVPKVVPLSQRNIMTNIADCRDCFTPRPDDALLAILPPFHAFGLTTSMLLPLCMGIRAVYYPDPTDGSALAQMIETYRATILVGTPTFLHGIVRSAVSPEQLATLRLVVSGAEKCTPRVYQALADRCPQTIVLEGYGVTECSPIISANREHDARPGAIGRVTRSLQYAVVDPAVTRRVEPGGEGLLLVRGPSVFDGYLDYPGPSPFVQFEGEKWYSTGDLVRQDADGVLTFCGRLKRFVKLGGEMVSLPAVEAVLESCYAADSDQGPVLAVVATADEDRPEIVLFTTRELDRESVNREIRLAGLSGLHNIRRVIKVDVLPLLGTGKTDYRALTERLGDGCGEHEMT